MIAVAPNCAQLLRLSSHGDSSLASSAPLEVGAQPLETLVETVTAGGAGGLDEPLTLSQAVQAELVGDLGSVHSVRQILLVSKHKQQGVAQFVLVEHALQLLTCLRNTLSVVRVDDENDAVRVLEVCEGERWEQIGARAPEQVSTDGEKADSRSAPFKFPKTYSASREVGSCPVHRRPTQ